MSKIIMLKDCPFCGGQASLDPMEFTTDGVVLDRIWFVECDDCHVSTGGEVHNPDEAVALWNRRTRLGSPLTEREEQDMLLVIDKLFKILGMEYDYW